MAILDSSEQVVSSVIDARDDVCISLSVCCPEYDHFVELVVSFEVPMIRQYMRFLFILSIAYRMSFLSFSTWSQQAFEPSRTLSARSS